MARQLVRCEAKEIGKQWPKTAKKCNLKEDYEKKKS